MKIVVACAMLFLWCGRRNVVNAFTTTPAASTSISFKRPSSFGSRCLCQPQSEDAYSNIADGTKRLHKNQPQWLDLKHWTSSLAVASAIFFSAWGSGGNLVSGGGNTKTITTLQPPAATAIELSSGAFSIQATSESGQSLLSAGVDTRKLLATLLQNRKQLTESVERIVQAVQTELQQPVFRELQKELLQIEGDVAPDIKILPPQNWQQTIKDISQGKINFILNGEIVNIAIDEKFSKQEDEIIVRVQGFKGVDLSAIETAKEETITGGIAEIYARRWEQRLEYFQKFWDTPLSGVQAGDTSLTAGPVVTGGLALAIVVAYTGSYSYYVSLQARAEADAEAKRKLTKAKKGAKAAENEQQEEADE